MGKFGWTVIGVLIAAFVADQYWNRGYYSDSALTVLRQIKHSFGCKAASGGSLNSLIFPGSGLY